MNNDILVTKKTVGINVISTVVETARESNDINIDGLLAFVRKDKNIASIIDGMDNESALVSLEELLASEYKKLITVVETDIKKVIKVSKKNIEKYTKDNKDLIKKWDVNMDNHDGGAKTIDEICTYRIFWEKSQPTDTNTFDEFEEFVALCREQTFMAFKNLGWVIPTKKKTLFKHRFAKITHLVKDIEGVTITVEIMYRDTDMILLGRLSM